MEFEKKFETLNKNERVNYNNSPLWRAALERYREQIEEDEDYHIVMETNSIEDLLEEAKARKSVFRNNKAEDIMHRLNRSLVRVDDFSAALALCFGADTKFTIIAWGSIRLIFSMVSSKIDVASRIITMLDELSSTLPRLDSYEDRQLVNSSMEDALINVYTDVICFYARCVRFFRSENLYLGRPLEWEKLEIDFSATIGSIKSFTTELDRQVETSRMQMHREVKEVMASMKKATINNCDTLRIQNMPDNLETSFWGREDVLAIVEKTLEPGLKPHELRSIALYGLGGVGKTRIARQFSEVNKKNYHTILWIASDNFITMSQSFNQIEKLLWPSEGNNESQDASSAIFRVKNWLKETDKNWLLVFDNADDIEVLRHAWPSYSRGSIIVTTRDSSAGLNSAKNGMHVRPFDEKSGSEVLLKSVGVDSDSKANQEHAEAIIRAIGGLPLALSQISSFIKNTRLSLFEFLQEYKDDLLELSSRTKNADGYQHTLNTVWQMSIVRLSSDARSLLYLLPYFHPDAINKSILIQGSSAIPDDAFKFLQSKWRREDVIKELNQNSLIEKSLENNNLSIHRLIQAVVINNQTVEERTKYFDLAVSMLSCGFPDTWSEDKGHQIETWSGCESCLPHVQHLISQREAIGINARDVQKYGELLLRCSWYLYERECYNVARSFVDAALNTFANKSTLAYASAVDLSGLIILDLNDPAEALTRFTEALGIRENAPSPAESLIASSFNNIALAYTEMGQLNEAKDAHEKAIQMRLTAGSDRIGNSYSNMASLLLRLGKAEEAEEMLKRCPSLKDFTDETFLNTGNPRFSGDMVLVSRIRYQQGRLSEAVRLSSKALVFRQDLLGNRLKTCDSLYDVAFFTHKQGNDTAPIELLLQMVEIAGSFPEGKGQLARAHYKLSTLYSERKELIAESEASLERAKQLRAELRPDLDEEPLTEESFRKLSLWMLW